MTLKSIDRALNTDWPTVKDMGVDHRRFDIIMTKKSLSGSDIITTFEQVSGKGMAECITGCRLC
jgi:hypothetical protein